MFSSRITFYAVRSLILFLAGIGIYTFYKSAVFYYSAEHTTGLITKIEIETRGKGKRLKKFYYPVIEFISQKGEQKIFKSNFGTSVKEFYRVGDHVSILYSCKKIMINSFVNIWIPTIYPIAGAVILLFCFKYPTKKKKFEKIF
ncbi:MAG: DUF3592 domain-containing protein [Planctomycetaceae bacterium]|jgi:hypothetical protein|nr:DUF3592 domain-containing protein [Planctomycetaceae bacterium]